MELYSTYIETDKFDEVVEKNHRINKDNERLLQVTADLHDEIDKLKEEKEDGD